MIFGISSILASEYVTANNEYIPEEIDVSGKFMPSGDYVDIDMSIYSEDELGFLNLILNKIENNLTSWKPFEIIHYKENMELSSYHKVASYFYIYYGESSAVSDVFQVFGGPNPITKNNDYYVVLNYKNARKYNQNINVVHDKVDEILFSFEPGSEVYILRQISEYLRDNVEYVAGHYTTSSALIDGKTVCNGYALAFNMLANRAGIKSDICIAKMEDDIYHAWNKVTLSDGSEYFYDISYFDEAMSDYYVHSIRPLHTNNYLLNSYVSSWFLPVEN